MVTRSTKPVDPAEAVTEAPAPRRRRQTPSPVKAAPKAPGRPSKAAAPVDPEATPVAAEEKQIPVGQHGGYRPHSGGRRPADSYEALAKARAKNEIFKANLAELDYKTKTGHLLPAEEVAVVWSDRVRIAKERLLSIPARVAPSVLRMTELRDVEHCIRDALHAVLEELARGASR